MELYIADSGKEYVNKVLKQIGEPEIINTPIDTVRARKYTPRKVAENVTVSTGTIPVVSPDKPMLRADWDAKDRRISRQGLLQSAFQAVSSFSADVDSLFENAEKLADKGLEYVNRI